MANVSFLPERESLLVAWSTNFNAKIVAAPTTYGLTAGQATTYTGLHNAFVSAFNAANADSTNSRSAITTKNTAKHALVANARLLAGIVQRFPGTTDTMRQDLGLTVHHAPSPIPAPAFAPSINVLSTTGNAALLRLTDPNNPTKRGKPGGVKAIAVFSFVGATPPDTQEAWRFEGNITRTKMRVAFPGITAGSKVWFTAYYLNERMQAGPSASPVTINIPGGSAMMEPG